MYTNWVKLLEESLDGVFSLRTKVPIVFFWSFFESGERRIARRELASDVVSRALGKLIHRFVRGVIGFERICTFGY